MSRNFRQSIKEWLEDEHELALQRVIDNLLQMTDSRGFHRYYNGDLLNLLIAQKGRVVRDLGEDMEVSINIAHGVYVDQGIKGIMSSYPSSMDSPFQMRGLPGPRTNNPIERWARGKIAYDSESDLKKKVYAIKRKIANKGVEAVPFFSSVINDQFYQRIFRGLQERGEEGISNDVADFIMAQALRVEQGSNGAVRLVFNKRP